MYAIKQFKQIITKDTLIALLEAEEVHRIEQADRYSKVDRQLRRYKVLSVLLALSAILTTILSTTYSIWSVLNVW